MREYTQQFFYLLCPWRSEEHTSELQSQSNLVCRLLLEKKKNVSPLAQVNLIVRAEDPCFSPHLSTPFRALSLVGLLQVQHHRHYSFRSVVARLPTHTAH